MKGFMAFLACMLVTVCIAAPTQGITGSTPARMGITLYVGGSGPGNYTRIQDAVDMAHDGDTVFVFDDSSPYNEHVVIKHAITLRGEAKETTVIDGMSGAHTLAINASGCTVSGFSIRNTAPNFAGINIAADMTTIEDTIISYNDYGIATFWIQNKFFQGITIRNNTFFSNRFAGIAMTQLANSTITQNTFTDIVNFSAIHLVYSHSVLISNNRMTHNNYGLTLYGCRQCLVTGNNVTGNTQCGIALLDSQGNSIVANNFIGNKRNAKFVTLIQHFGNHWDGNYWDDQGRSVYPILGRIALQQFAEIGIIPILQIDWHPARTPN